MKAQDAPGGRIVQFIRGIGPALVHGIRQRYRHARIQMALRPLGHHQMGKAEQCLPFPPLRQAEKTVRAEQQRHGHFNTDFLAQLTQGFNAITRPRQVQFAPFHAQTLFACNRQFQHFQPFFSACAGSRAVRRVGSGH